MATAEIESYLAKHYPGKPWVVDEKMGVGLPMIDGIVLYCRIDGLDPLSKVAEQVIAITKGVKL